MDMAHEPQKFLLSRGSAGRSQVVSWRPAPPPRRSHRRRWRRRRWCWHLAFVGACSMYGVVVPAFLLLLLLLWQRDLMADTPLSLTSPPRPVPAAVAA